MIKPERSYSGRKLRWAACLIAATLAAPVGAAQQTPGAAGSGFNTNITDFGAVADLRQGDDGVTLAASSLFRAPSARFSARDAGKLIYIEGAGPSGGEFQSTIASVAGPNSITLAVAASTAVANAAYTFGTDNRPAMQSAIDAAQTAGGGTVRVPTAATCYAMAQAVAVTGSNVRIQGDGPGSCLLSLFIDPLGDGGMVIAISSFGGPLTDIEISGLRLQNSGAVYVPANAGVALLDVSSNRNSVSELHVHDMVFHTENRECFTNGATLDQFWIENNIFDYCAEGGIYLAQRPTDGYVRGNHFFGALGRTAGSAIRIKNSANLEISGNDIRMSGFANGIQIVDYLSVHPRAVANIIYNFDRPGSSGIVLGFTEDALVVRNDIYGSRGNAIQLTVSRVGPGTPGAIRSTIDGNHIYNCQQWGIAVTGTAGTYSSSARVVNNSVIDCFQGIEIDTTGGQNEVAFNALSRNLPGNGPAFSIHPAIPSSTYWHDNLQWNHGANSVAAGVVSSRNVLLGSNRFFRISAGSPNKH
jgi:parallel beta helix pectate lyase-like protein